MTQAAQARRDPGSPASAIDIRSRTSATAREFILARFLFPRALGLVFAIAFASLWVQIDGLIGSRGMLPIAEFLDRVRALYGTALVHELPTLCWWNASDGCLHVQCALGLLLSASIVLGFAQRVSLALAWLLYLSLCVAGQSFLSFQWDVLLLETSFFAIFFAPRAWIARLERAEAPSDWSLFAMRWILFRLMLASGAVKLASGDACWRGLSALALHYQTQPLPTPLAWYAHQLPEWFQRVSCALMFGIELLLPWCVFGPRRARIAAAMGFLVLQTLIAASGNYGFFNLLTAVLCIPLLDDALLVRALPQALAARLSRSSASSARDRVARDEAERGGDASVGGARGGRTRSDVARGAGWVFAASAAILSSLMLWARLDRTFTMPAPFAELEAWIAPLRTLNTYGLFAVMTTERDEITIEGSRDGLEWKPYVFEDKPGDPRRAPPWVAPHMPRLDWQMWFAALGRARDNPWFERLMQRLLEGSPPVLALFESNPFPDSPPRYVRARLERYEFTSRAERARDGDWWSRVERGTYAYPASLASSPR
jgi:hypothetical protein